MSFSVSDPISGFDSPDGWGPQDDAPEIGARLRGGGIVPPPPPPDPPPPPPEDPEDPEGGVEIDPGVNVVGAFRRAFPGGGNVLPAVGAGAAALSGADRSAVIVYKVTNRNNSGAGSYRQVMNDVWNEPNQDALKIVIFTTGGYIDMTSELQTPTTSATSSLRRLRNVYIAGQTAPGGGVCLRRPSGSGKIHKFCWDIQDIVIRGVRFRYGYRETSSTNHMNLMFRQNNRLMIDSCSFSWAPGRQIHSGVQNISRSQLMHRATIQNCMLYEPFAPHRTVLSGWQGDNDNGTKKGDLDGKVGTIYRNFMGSGQRRAPNCGTYTEILNNIMWNMREDAGWIGSTSFLDYIGNTVVDGPLTQSVNRLQVFGIRRADYLFGPARFAYAEGWYPSWMVEKNLHLKRPGSGGSDRLSDVNADNWSNDISGRSGGVRQGIVDGWGPTDQAILDQHLAAGTSGFTGLLEFRRNKRLWDIGPGDREWGVCQHFGWPAFPAPILNPYTAMDIIKANAGVHWRVNAAGQWVRDRRDAADARQIAELNSGNAVVDHVSKLGGQDGDTATMNARFPYPSLAVGTPYADTNGDGVPDAYYTAMGYNPSGPSRVAEVGHHGYTFIENWINGRNHHTGEIRVLG